jgi:thioredoxin reductase (NADPH)
MRQPNVTVYGSRSCPDTQRTTQFLDHRKVAYEFKDVDENPAFSEYVAGLNHGKRVIPTVRINNATFINHADDVLGKAVEESEPKD